LFIDEWLLHEGSDTASPLDESRGYRLHLMLSCESIVEAHVSFEPENSPNPRAAIGLMRVAFLAFAGAVSPNNTDRIADVLELHTVGANHRPTGRVAVMESVRFELVGRGYPEWSLHAWDADGP
jgi:hypothetical protein